MYGEVFFSKRRLAMGVVKDVGDIYRVADANVGQQNLRELVG